MYIQYRTSAYRFIPFPPPRRPAVGLFVLAADDPIESDQNRLFEPTLPATAAAAAASFLILRIGIYVRCTACAIFDLPPTPNRRFGDFLCNGFCSELNYIFLLIADGVKYYQLRQPPPTSKKCRPSQREGANRKKIASGPEWPNGKKSIYMNIATKTTE